MSWTWKTKSARLKIKLADMVVLEKDLHDISASEISTTKVNLTMINRKITHRNGL